MSLPISNMNNFVFMNGENLKCYYDIIKMKRKVEVEWYSGSAVIGTSNSWKCSWVERCHFRYSLIH